MQAGCQWEIHELWNRYYEQKDRIVKEEINKDNNKIFSESYEDHPLIKDLLDRTQKEEDEIINRYGEK